MEKIENTIRNLEELISLANVGISELKTREILNMYNLNIGDFILIEHVKDVIGCITNKNTQGKTFVILGMYDNELYVKGLNNDHVGLLHFEYVLKYKHINFMEL